MRMPLGDYRAFQWWSGRPRPWGPEGTGWRAWFGGKVVDGLCDVLDEHLASSPQCPVAIGCVPWLTSEAVIDRLARFAACCVVLDKGGYVPGRLVESAEGLPNTVLPGLDLKMPKGPIAQWPHELGPIRRLGWSGREASKPLLHAKLLVLGELSLVTYRPDDAPEFEEAHFEPRSVWCGSANWTENSRAHLEVGFWCDDRALADEATSFLANVIAFSEPIGSDHVNPEPNLVDWEPDPEDIAAWEAARLDSLADDDPYG